MELNKFVDALEKELEDRFNKCEDFAATPSSILQAVLNAVAGAKFTASQPDKAGEFCVECHCVHPMDGDCIKF